MVSLRDITLEDLEADPKVIAIADKLIDTICLVQNFAAEKKPYQKAIILHEAFTGIAGHLQVITTMVISRPCLRSPAYYRSSTMTLKLAVQTCYGLPCTSYL